MLRFLIVFLAAVSLSGNHVPAEANGISIATGDYPPFTDPKADDGGSVNSIVQKMVDGAGFDATFKYMPWARGLELTRAGRFDATSFWYYSEEREADFIHVGPIFADRLVFFHRTDTKVPKWDDLEDLSELKIGAVTGYTLTPELWDLADRGLLKVEVAPNDETNFRKLMAGRIDLYPMSLESGWLLIDRIFDETEKDKISTVQKPLAVTDGYLLVSRANENADLIAQALEDSLFKLNAEASVQKSAVADSQK